MSIRSFYSKRFFEKSDSKLTIQILLIFWVIFASAIILGFDIPLIGFHNRFLGAFWLILSVHQLIGLVIVYREGLYFKAGEKRQIKKNIAPEELIEEAKKEVEHGKK